MEKKLEKAIAYLDEIKKLDKPLEPVNRTLPKYVQIYGHGYCVKVPGKKTKYFLSKVKSNEEKLELALAYRKKIL